MYPDPSHRWDRLTRIMRSPISEAESQDHQKDAEDQGVRRNDPNDGKPSRRRLEEQKHAQDDRDQAAQAQAPFIGNFIP